MSRLDLPPSLDTFEELAEAYSESHRAYHNQRHISSCLESVKSVSAELSCPVEVELALWFHDAIYDTRSATNEKDSADWAVRFLGKNERSRRVEELILATEHSRLLGSSDQEWIVDIDLSILGAGPEAYEEFERSIREEYSWVPEELFRAKRTEVLQTFLDREFVYATGHFRETLESTARFNLQQAIQALST